MAGDVIYSANQQPVASLDALRAIVEGLNRGSPLVLQVERRGSRCLLSLVRASPIF